MRFPPRGTIGGARRGCHRFSRGDARCCDTAARWGLGTMAIGAGSGAMLEVEDLSVSYGGLAALRGVSLAVAEGQFVAIVGPNGAGKTTLFKAISGTVRPVSGTIMFEGQDLLAVKPSERAHLGIAHVPEGRQVFASLSVLENLEMGGYSTR